MVPRMTERLMESSEEELMVMADLVSVFLYFLTLPDCLEIQKGVSTARSDDTKSLKGVVLDWITPQDTVLHPPLSLEHKNHLWILPCCHRCSSLPCWSWLEWYRVCDCADPFVYTLMSHWLVGCVRSFPVAKWLSAVINGHCCFTQIKNTTPKILGRGCLEVNC